MGLTAWLLRHTPPRPLVATVPGGTGARLAVERLVRERGWRFAASPAEANVLVVAGPVGSDVEPYVARVWEQLPAPRARADVRSAPAAAAELTAAAARLRDVDHQRQQAERTPPAQPVGHETHGGHDMREQHGHDMGGMAMPGGVPMAGRAEDRDGLMLDRLHLPLGPVLPDWPAGLIVRTSLQGDVVQHATVETLDPGPAAFWPGRTGNAARALDSCARLLSVAGWVDAASVARRLRDAALHDAMPTGLMATWARRVRRSRTLRWLLAGVGVTPDDASTPSELRGDALARLHRWLDPAPEPATAASTQWTLDHLPDLLAGSELAGARLIVASLDPDLEVLAHHG